MFFVYIYHRGFPIKRKYDGSFYVPSRIPHSLNGRKFIFAICNKNRRTVVL